MDPSEVELVSVNERGCPGSRLGGGAARLLAPVALALFGCGGAPAKPALMAQSGDVFVTVSQLRTQDYDFSAHFRALVTICADEIIAESNDDAIRRRALLWKLNAVQAARSAAFHHDPLVALYDLWALTLQQRDYFTQGNGVAMLVDRQRCAASISNQLADDVARLARSVTTSGDVSEMRNWLEQWAERNPIQSDLLIRRSAASDISALAPQAPHKGMQAVESLEETSRDLADRITILSTDLPSEARWQAEFLINAIFEERLEGSIEQISRTFGRVNLLLDELEPFMDNQRDAFAGALERERTALVDAATVAGDSLQQGVEAERSALLSSIHEEMAWWTGELNATGRALIDHLFVRALEFVFILLAIALIVYLLLGRRPPRSRPALPK